MLKLQPILSSRPKHSRMSPCRLVILGSAALITPMSDAFAYIDPNAAGWLFQLLFPLLAAVLAGWAFVRNRVAGMWNRLMAFFQPRRQSNK